MENKLDPEFKAKWIAALRSGEYAQCRYVIARGSSYCCLGVAAVVAGVQNITEGYDSNLIPAEIRGGYSNETAIKLMRLNDTEKKSFSEIADYIEANL